MEGEETALPRAEGCVLWLYEGAWERGEVEALGHPPTPFAAWARQLHEWGWTAHWTPQGALTEGPYRGGVVVAIDVAGDRSYVAVPPEALDRLPEVLPARDARLAREDAAAAVENPEGHGLRVTRLDPLRWEREREVVPTADLPTEGWARVIREGHLRVEMERDGFLPVESAWPGGQIVAVGDGTGRRYYFAVPRGAIQLAIELAVEGDMAARAAVAAAQAAGF